MKTRLALLVVVAAAAFAASAVLPARAPVLGAPNAYAHTCFAGGGYVHAEFPWGHRCIRAGQFCKLVRNLEYRKYGFLCVGGPGLALSDGKLKKLKKKKGK